MIEIIKSSEYNARAVKSIDLANKIPGYNFSYPVLNTIDICNILMIGGSIEISIERMGKSKWSYNLDTKELTIEKPTSTETHLITNTEELICEMDKYFNQNKDELWKNTYKTNIKKSMSKKAKKNTQKSETSSSKKSKLLIDDQGYPLEFFQLSDYVNCGIEIQKYYDWVKKNNYLYKLNVETHRLLISYGAPLSEDIIEEERRRNSYK